MDAWKESFLKKLNHAQSEWNGQFEHAMEKHVDPAFDELRPFLTENGFSVSRPLREQGRRSYKFELAENAYVLVLFRAGGVGEFEVRSEIFVPGKEPQLGKVHARVADITADWAPTQLQKALDQFIESLGGARKQQVDEEELVTL